MLAESGEDAIVSCNRCEYAANVQKAEIKLRRPAGRDVALETPKLEKVSTPGKRSVAEVAAFLRQAPERFIKTLVYKTDQKELVAVLARGDHEINDFKLPAVLHCREVALADEAEVRAAAAVPPGFMGPIGLKLRIVADQAVHGIKQAVTGANEVDAHYINVDQERDFTPSAFADLRLAMAGDPCPRCEDGDLETYRCIEVGMVFYMGRKYSE